MWDEPHVWPPKNAYASMHCGPKEQEVLRCG